MGFPFHSPVAQSVELVAVNHPVGGPSPSGGAVILVLILYNIRISTFIFIPQLTIAGGFMKAFSLLLLRHALL